jgi:hypothetical protein
VHSLSCLAELEYADGWGDSLLHDIRSVLSQRWLPAAWGMSIGALVKDGAVLPIKVSLTRTPAYEDALLLGIGADALTTWEMLTDISPNLPAALASSVSGDPPSLPREIGKAPEGWVGGVDGEGEATPPSAASCWLESGGWPILRHIW